MLSMLSTRESIAANVRAAKGRYGLSQQSIADILNLSRRSVADRLEARLDFSANELASLAAYLNVPVATFFGESLPSERRAS